MSLCLNQTGVTKFSSLIWTFLPYYMLLSPVFTDDTISKCCELNTNATKGFLKEHVQGEVYEVDNKMLGVLDILECHPEYYERKIDKIILQDSEEEIDCWIYLLFRYKPHMMELPFLKAYFSEGDPEKKYVAKYSREVIGKEYWSDVKIMESPSK